jgi:two-component system, NarL family, invasion response regulator UvrY
VRILIADDHAIVRKGLRQILDEEPGLAVVGEAQSAQEVLELSRTNQWDLVILDINMPGRSGLDALAELHRERPALPILILSMYPEDQYGLRVLKAGAVGYLNKQSAPEELVKAIKMIRGGGKYISETLAEKMASSLSKGEEKAVMELLSDRELEVLLLIASGKTATDIATELNLSVKTVSTYRIRILQKMDLKNNAEITYFAIHNGLLE